MIYTTILLVHSWWRWVVMALLAVVIARAFVGWQQARAWSRLDERLHIILVSAFDLQLLLGISLYALLSPFVRAFWENAAIGMKQPALRFFGIEHAFGMLAALIVVHVGRRRSRKSEGKLRHRQVWTSGLAALLLILASVPWPFLKYGRPLFRSAEIHASTRTVSTFGLLFVAFEFPRVVATSVKTLRAISKAKGEASVAPAHGSMREAKRPKSMPCLVRALRAQHAVEQGQHVG